MTREQGPSPEPGAIAEVVLAAIDELKGVDVRTLDVRDQTSITDTIIVVSGTSQRHLKSLADRVLERSREAGIKPLGIEGERGADWYLVDLGDVVVHVMSREKRDFYNLEKLWSMHVDDSAAGSG
ncbi:ribosome silencing factor [Halofilum ochraceum]|uniref:ribosome silencing factor n=1 Tax=Halofilum ochraceum TaxID=1611323 RepID=UPI0008335575|nr:ribosome silencing factor [Halofilum ochraceum]